MRSAAILLAALALLAPPASVADAQTTAGREDVDAPLAFWSALGDSTLNRLVLEAVDANPGLRAAQARARGARADRVGAALDLAPTVTASSSYSRQRLSSASFPGGAGTLPEHDLWDAGVNLSWELDLFGRGRRTLQGRRALVASADEEIDDVRVLLAAEVAGAYFDLRGAQERLAVARRNADNQAGSLEVTLERLEAGRGTGFDTERAQAQLSTTLAAIPSLEGEIVAIQYRIAALIGRPFDELASDLDAEVMPPELPSAPSVTSLDGVVRDRPDVRSAERQLTARSAFVAASKADYLPRVSLSGRAGYTASALDALGNAGTPRYAIGPVVSWPLLDVGRVKAGVDAARADEAEAAARFEQAVLQAQAEVQTSLVAYEKASERLSHLAEAAAASERATELARLRFEEGATGFLEVLDAERTLLDAQDRLALGRTEAAAGLIAVYRALGGRWTIPENGLE
jgi:NodT family efflux transporter outer membrane factor (OMF) lipoprotein